MKESVHISIDNLENPLDSLNGDAYTSALAKLHTVAPLLRQLADYHMLLRVRDGHNTSKDFEGLMFSRGGVASLDNFIGDIETYAGKYEEILHPEEITDPSNSLPEIN